MAGLRCTQIVLRMSNRELAFALTSWRWVGCSVVLSRVQGECAAAASEPQVARELAEASARDLIVGAGMLDLELTATYHLKQATCAKNTNENTKSVAIVNKACPSHPISVGITCLGQPTGNIGLTSHCRMLIAQHRSAAKVSSRRTCRIPLLRATWRVVQMFPKLAT